MACIIRAGLVDAFDEKVANLRGIHDLAFVGDVRHKAMVEVDEEGTTAAAATAVVVREGNSNSFSCLCAFFFYFHAACLFEPSVSTVCTN